MIRHRLFRPTVSAVVLVAAICTAFAASPLHALETTRGGLRLVLHESNGRFSLYAKHQETGKFRPLFVANDPRTSFLGVLVGNRVYRMGESSGVSQDVQQTDDGGRFLWTSSSFRVIQDFAFTEGTDGLMVTVRVENTSERALSLGVRLLLDTYLGEDQNAHFRVAGGTAIRHEQAFSFDSMPAWWLSDNDEENDGVALRAPLLGQTVTKPDRVVFANWKRLNDTTWNYDVNSARDFNLLPYSINDSAVCHYYDPLQVLSGDARTVEIALRISTDVVPETPATDIPSVAPGVEESETSAAPAEYLEDINGLIERMNERLQSEEQITDEELAEFRRKLEALRGRMDE